MARVLSSEEESTGFGSSKSCESHGDLLSRPRQVEPKRKKKLEKGGMGSWNECMQLKGDLGGIRDSVSQLHQSRKVIPGGKEKMACTAAGACACPLPPTGDVHGAQFAVMACAAARHGHSRCSLLEAGRRRAWRGVS